jgi:hypothetical protein
MFTAVLELTSQHRLMHRTSEQTVVQSNSKVNIAIPPHITQ